jgi:hypothetical protein
MTDSSDGRVQAAQAAMKMTPEALVVWAVERAHDDRLRQNIVQLEFARRVASAQITTAKATRWSAWFMLASVVVLVLTGAASAVFQDLAWMHPHVPK